MVKDELHKIEQIKKKRLETDTEDYEPIDELEGKHLAHYSLRGYSEYQRSRAPLHVGRTESGGAGED